MELKEYKNKFITKGKTLIERYGNNLAKINAGRANPKILDSILVECYETKMPINQIATITMTDARHLHIKPYDKNINKMIVKAITDANIGLNAVDEGDKTRINFPEITTERRQELIKMLSRFTEQARIEIREVRHEIMKKIKKDESLSEDEERRYGKEIQKLTDEYNDKIQKMTKEKENHLMNF